MSENTTLMLNVESAPAQEDAAKVNVAKDAPVDAGKDVNIDKNTCLRF